MIPETHTFFLTRDLIEHVDWLAKKRERKMGKPQTRSDAVQYLIRKHRKGMQRVKPVELIRAG